MCVCACVCVCCNPAAPSTSVTLNSSAGETPVHGSGVILSCTVSLPASLHGTVTDIEWVHEEEDVPSTSTINTGTTSVTSDLVFPSISASDGGGYTCIAKIMSPYVAPYYQNGSLTIVIQRESKSTAYVHPNPAHYISLRG